jgi:hypothetical protein
MERRFEGLAPTPILRAGRGSSERNFSLGADGEVAISEIEELVANPGLRRLRQTRFWRLVLVSR